MQNVYTGANNQVVSAEASFIQLYVDALVKLQDTWMQSPDGFDEKKFHAQHEFLLRLIPDLNKQEEIRKRQIELYEKFSAAGDDMPEVRASLCVVTEMVMFIGSTFEIFKSNVWGNALHFMKETPESINTMEDTFGDEDDSEGETYDEV